MTVLTAIATICTPREFLVGTSCVSLDRMPRLSVPWAYLVPWLAMIAITVGLTADLRRLGCRRGVSAGRRVVRGLAPAVRRQCSRPACATGSPAAQFRVADVRAEYARLRALGVRFTEARLEQEPVTTAVVDDTRGNLIQLASASPG